MSAQYFVGLDLGQTQDYTAVAILERPFVQSQQPGVERNHAYNVRWLHRFPLGTPYPQIVREMGNLVNRSEFPPRSPTLNGCTLVVDQTGVGRPVVDMLRQAHLPVVLCPITITGGQAITVDDERCYHVPKKELITTVQVLLQSKRLRVAASLKDARVLESELATFRMKITPAGHETFESLRERDHDDLVLAVALAAWFAERHKSVGYGTLVEYRRSPTIAERMKESQGIGRRTFGR